MLTSILEQEALTRSVIGAFYDVYNCLGFGFLEHLYLLALEQELRTRGHAVTRELGIQVQFKGFPLGMQRLDMVVDSVLMIEAKSTYRRSPRTTRHAPLAGVGQSTPNSLNPPRRMTQHGKRD